MGGQDISKQITGGELSGALKFRDEVLDPAQHNLVFWQLDLPLNLISYMQQQGPRPKCRHSI